MGFYEEQIEPTLNKMVAQGASEVAHALYAGNAYVAYSATERAAGASLPEAPELSQTPSYDNLKLQVAEMAPQVEPAEQGLEH